MVHTNILGIAALLAATLAASGTPARAQSGDVRLSAPVVNIDATGDRISAAGAQVTVGGTADEVRAAGAIVSLTGTVEREANAVGATVSASGNIGGRLRTAAASLNIRGTIGGDLEAAGAVVTIDGTVGGRVRVGGATVTIGPSAVISGALEGGAAVLQVSGQVSGPTEIGGAVVTFDATTNRTVTIHAQQVTIGPSARIGGDLIIESPTEPVISEGAVISGSVRRVEPSRWWDVVPPWSWTILFFVLMALGTIVAGIVLLLFGGRLFSAATNQVRLRPGSSLVLGVATVVLIPAIAVVLMASVIGLSAGFAVLFLLPFLVIFGHAIAAAGIASGIFVRDRGPLGVMSALLLLVVGAILIALVGIIPWVGPPLVFVVLLLGVGAFTRTVGARLRRAEPEPM